MAIVSSHIEKVFEKILKGLLTLAHGVLAPFVYFFSKIKNPHKRTHILGLQTDFVLIYLVFYAKSS